MVTKGEHSSARCCSGLSSAALGTSATDQDLQVIKYLISQGADCKVPLSFIEYNGPIALAGTSPYKELLPMVMQSCA